MEETKEERIQKALESWRNSFTVYTVRCDDEGFIGMKISRGVFELPCEHCVENIENTVNLNWNRTAVKVERGPILEGTVKVPKAYIDAVMMHFTPEKVRTVFDDMSLLQRLYKHEDYKSMAEKLPEVDKKEAMGMMYKLEKSLNFDSDDEGYDETYFMARGSHKRQKV
jgi:hypothetical protein